MLKRIKKILHIEPKTESLSVYEKIDNLFDSMEEEVLVMQIGSDMTPFNESIIEDIGHLRDEIKDECGFIIPPVVVRKNSVLQENEFTVEIRNKKVCNRYVIPTKDGIGEEVYDALKTAIYGNINDIFTNEIAEKYINIVQKNNGWLIWNVTNVLSIIQIKAILSEIIAAGKSINNINYIFEKIGEQVLLDSEYKDFLKRYNPQTIAKNIAKVL